MRLPADFCRLISSTISLTLTGTCAILVDCRVCRWRSFFCGRQHIESFTASFLASAHNPLITSCSPVCRSPRRSPQWIWLLLPARRGRRRAASLRLFALVFRPLLRISSTSRAISKAMSVALSGRDDSPGTSRHAVVRLGLAFHACEASVLPFNSRCTDQAAPEHAAFAFYPRRPRKIRRSPFAQVSAFAGRSKPALHLANKAKARSIPWQRWPNHRQSFGPVP